MALNQVQVSKIGSSDGGDYEDYCRLGSDAVYSGKYVPTF